MMNSAKKKKKKQRKKQKPCSGVVERKGLAQMGGCAHTVKMCGSRLTRASLAGVWWLPALEFWVSEFRDHDPLTALSL